MTSKFLTKEIGELLAEISHNREQIKQDYIKAWLAQTVPDGNLNLTWIVENVRLVEQWSPDRLSVRWHLELKPT